MYHLHISDESFVHPETDWFFNDKENLQSWFEQEFIFWYFNGHHSDVVDFYLLNSTCDELTHKQLLDIAKQELKYYCDIEEIKTVD